jgi:hypothetical protein
MQAAEFVQKLHAAGITTSAWDLSFIVVIVFCVGLSAVDLLLGPIERAIRHWLLSSPGIRSSKGSW